MQNLRNRNAPPVAGLVQTYLDTAYDVVKSVYDNLAIIQQVATALDDLDLADFLSVEDLNSLNKLNTIVVDATLGSVADFATAAQGALADSAIQGPLASQAEAEAGIENTKPTTSLRVAQAIAALGGGKLNNWTATADPVAGDDGIDGYTVGSLWVNVTLDTAWIAVDVSVAAAVWLQIGQTDAALLTLVAPAIVNVQTGTSYTIQASDNGKEIIFTNAGAIAVTLPDTLDTLFQCIVKQAGAGVPTVTPDTDTINGAGVGVTPSAQWKGIHLVQYSATNWFGTF